MPAGTEAILNTAVSAPADTTKNTAYTIKNHRRTLLENAGGHY